MAFAERWASDLPCQAYAIDDETAIKVTDGTVEVVSEGYWKLFGGDEVRSSPEQLQAAQARSRRR